MNKVQKRFRHCTLGFLAMLFLSGNIAYQDSAPETGILDFQQSDLDNDGDPDQVILSCSCSTDSDVITIYDTSDTMQLSDAWDAKEYTTNSVWLFDIKNDGKIDLLVVFEKDINTNTSRASFYDDTNNQAGVQYHLNGVLVVIDESDYPTLTAVVNGNWYYDDTGEPNQNVELLLDGPVSIGYFEFIDQEASSKYILHDGTTDVAFKLVDADHNSRPEYFISQLYTELPDGYGRSKLYVNSGENQTLPSDTAFLWPYLNFDAAEYYATTSFFDLLPAVEINWDEGHIEGVELPGYPVEQGYWVNSTAPIEEGALNVVYYEAPHAFYDLANNNNGLPELNVRLFAPAQYSVEEVRYSWNQFSIGELLWDYKVGVVGIRLDENEGLVDFPEFDLQMTPYEELPYWVTNREWDLTTFVAREEGRQFSSEGIYAWTPWAGEDPVSPENPSAEAFDAMYRYLMGQSTSPPAEYLQSIQPGYRGEYNYTKISQPYLYYSLIDHRLHLKDADWGIYQIDVNTYVTMKDADNDGYFDQWNLYSQDILIEQLNITANYFVYHSPTQNVVGIYDGDIVDFEMLPPRNHTEWQQMGDQLTSLAVDLTLDTLSPIVERINKSDLLSISNGANQQEDADYHFRLLNTGFRFVTEISEDTEIQQDFGSFEPGKYLIEMQDGDLSITPSTSPDIHVAISPIDAAHQYYPIPITVEIKNQGLEDADDIYVKIHMQADEYDEVIEETNITVFGESNYDYRFTWTPEKPGTWTVYAEIAYDDTQTNSLDVSTSIVVEESRPSLWSTLIALDGEHPVHGILLIPMLIGILAFATISINMLLTDSWEEEA